MLLILRLHLLTSPNFSEFCTYRALNTYRDLCQWRLIHSLAKVILLELQQLNHQTCKCLVGWRFRLYVLKTEIGSTTLNYSLRTSNIDKKQTRPKDRYAAGFTFPKIGCLLSETDDTWLLPSSGLVLKTSSKNINEHYRLLLHKFCE